MKHGIAFKDKKMKSLAIIHSAEEMQVTCQIKLARTKKMGSLAIIHSAEEMKVTCLDKAAKTKKWDRWQ